jgi:hypothetical protein
MRYRFIFTDWFNRNLKSLGKRNPALQRDLELFFRLWKRKAIRLYPVRAALEKPG